MTDTHYMADQSMIPPLPADISPQMGQPPALPQGGQRPLNGVPKFYLKKKRVTNDDGSVTFKYVEWVDIITPGDNRSTPSQKVTDRHRNLWPTEYAAFRRGEEVARDGWPIDMWSYLNEQQVHALKAMNIFTVEDVAGLADSNLGHIPMGRTLKNQATAALRTKKEQDSVEAMRQKDELNQQAIKSLEDNNIELQRQLEIMQAQMAAMVEAKGDEAEDTPKRRGRPPKNSE